MAAGKLALGCTALKEEAAHNRTLAAGTEEEAARGLTVVNSFGSLRFDLVGDRSCVHFWRPGYWSEQALLQVGLVAAASSTALSARSGVVAVLPCCSCTVR